MYFCRFVRLQAQPHNPPRAIQLAESLLILLVHCRDVTKALQEAKTQSPEDFCWRRQLRYYLRRDDELTTDCIVQQLHVAYVGTPLLKDKFLSLQKKASSQERIEASAGLSLQLALRTRVLGKLLAPRTNAAHRQVFPDSHDGFAFQLWRSAGGAGRHGWAGLSVHRECVGVAPRRVLDGRCFFCKTCLGKTETVKDLAKALAVPCVVFNCSSDLDFRFTSRLFSGLAQSGAWACLDEFNRIDGQVLSVVAQQLLLIQTALRARETHVEFEGETIPLNPRLALPLQRTKRPPARRAVG